jgi:hypothetical protein
VGRVQGRVLVWCAVCVWVLSLLSSLDVSGVGDTERAFKGVVVATAAVLLTSPRATGVADEGEVGDGEGGSGVDVDEDGDEDDDDEEKEEEEEDDGE